MGKDPGFDTALAHRYFSAFCFNKTWEFIEKASRTSAEDEEMIRLSLASLWHWTQREDCSGKNLSVGYWQASRVHSLAGRAGEARHYADLCLQHSKGAKPFHIAYAYEALARAEKAAGNSTLLQQYKAEAVRLAQTVEDDDDRKLLIDDLNSI